LTTKKPTTQAPAELLAALLAHPETPEILRRGLAAALNDFQNEIDLYQLTQTPQSIQLTFDLYKAGQETRKGGARR
jgi:hypothetical protein